MHRRLDGLASAEDAEAHLTRSRAPGELVEHAIQLLYRRLNELDHGARRVRPAERLRLRGRVGEAFGREHQWPRRERDADIL